MMKHLSAAWKGNGAAGTYVAVLILGIVGWFILGSIPALAVVLSKGVVSGDVSELQQMMSANGYMLTVFSSFVIGLLLFALLVPLMHKRGFCSVVNGGKRIRWSHFFVAFGLYFVAIALVQGGMMLARPDNFVWQFSAGPFFRMLPLLLICVPLQTLFEEYLFRGYLMQASAAWTRRVWVALLLPALLFGLAHSANPEVGAYGFVVMMAQYLLFGLIFGWFTLADDGLEVSWGMHTANNLFLLLFLTEEHSAMPTPALWRQVDATPGWVDVLLLLLVALLLWVVLKRLFHWHRPQLFQKIDDTNREELPTLSKENKEGI